MKAYARKSLKGDLPLSGHAGALSHAPEFSGK